MSKLLKLALTLIISSIGLIIPLHGQSFSDREILLEPIHYKLSLKTDYDSEKLIGNCQITVFNPSDRPVQIIPLLLYRLMKVKSVQDEQGRIIPFKQQVLSYEDWEVLQVNYIEVLLENPFLNGSQRKIIVEYEGYLLGYAETGMLYVKDRIDPDFTIIRPDCNAYPEIGCPSSQANRRAGLPTYDYSIDITVPDSFIVANGGKLIDKRSNDGWITYFYQSIKPSSRIDIAIAKYEILEHEKNKIFYFPEDTVGAVKVMEALTKSFDLYTKWWGNLRDFQGFTVIEIPDGWGSQADVTSIIQTAPAFKDEKQLRQLYHEVSHFWNVKSNDTFSPRWNEGLATFIEYLTVGKLENRKVLRKETIRIANQLRKHFKENPEYKNIPLIDFGKEKVTGLSYSVGMFLFQVLYNLVEEHKFNEIIGSFYQEYHQTGATTDEFVQHAIRISEIDLTKFFDDWFFGAMYCDYIDQGLSIDEIVLKYRNN